MKSALVLCATRQGETRHLAERVASDIRAFGLSARIADVRGAAALDLATFDMLLLVSSVHADEHEREIVEFVTRHRAALETVPSAFISVIMAHSAAELETTAATAHGHAGEIAARMLAKLADETQWNPSSVKPAAGTRPCKQYHPFLTFIMMPVAKVNSGAAETSQDADRTDWKDLDAFVGQFVSGAAGVDSHPGNMSART